MGRLFLSIPMLLAGAAPAKTHRVIVTGGKRPAIRFWSGQKWIWRIAFAALCVATVDFAWSPWQRSTRLVPPQGVWASLDSSRYLLRLSGSKTTGTVLAPELVKAWLGSIGASEVQETHRLGRDGNQIPEWLIRAKFNGNPVAVEVRARGSVSAFKDMAAGDADIGIASREINSSEVTQLMPLGNMRSEASEHVLGFEGIAVIVSRSNNISPLSRSTLKKIFAGEITNWSAFGAKRLPIHLYALTQNSRTYGSFSSLVLGDVPMANAKHYVDSAKLESDVAGDPGGIGFVSTPYIKGTRSVSINDVSAAALKRRLYLYTAAVPQNPAATDFVRFAISPKGQNIVRQARFAPELAEGSDSSNNSPSVAVVRDNLKVSISADRVNRNIPASAEPPKSTPPQVTAAVPDTATGPTKALPPASGIQGPPASRTITASLQAPAVTASLQAQQPPPQATSPVLKAPVPPPSSEHASPAANAAPPPPLPDRPALPPEVNVAPPLAPAPLTPPLAITSHAVTVTDYPLMSIRQQQEGNVTIKYLVREDGSVGDCDVTKSSGKSLLDDAACAMVKRHWRFKPAMQAGKPVAEFLTADVVFRLTDAPKTPKPTIMTSFSSPPAPTAPPLPPGMSMPPVAITSHTVTASDYPPISMRMHDEGKVMIRYLVREDGSVGNCDVTKSSGKSLLDRAACDMVTRHWKFEPAIEDGKPMAEFLTAEVVFKLN